MKEQLQGNQEKVGMGGEEEMMGGESLGRSEMPPPFSLDSSPLQRKRNPDLPEDVQTNMEDAYGHDFSNVKIHPDSDSAEEMDARAYTKGDDVHFAPGEFDPGSETGQDLIGHEFAHIAQQREGRVQTTTMEDGNAVNDNQSLEEEADEMSARAKSGEAVNEMKPAAPPGNIVQKQVKNFSAGMTRGVVQLMCEAGEARPPRTDRAHPAFQGARPGIPAAIRTALWDFFKAIYHTRQNTCACGFPNTSGATKKQCLS